MSKLLELLKRIMRAVTKADHKVAKKVREAELEARKATDAILGDADES